MSDVGGRDLHKCNADDCRDMHCSARDHVQYVCFLLLVGHSARACVCIFVLVYANEFELLACVRVCAYCDCECVCVRFIGAETYSE